MKEQIICCFTQHVELTFFIATHTMQKHFKGTENEARDFIVAMKAWLLTGNKDEIINMDQTPIVCSFHAKTTLKQREQKPLRYVHQQLT